MARALEAIEERAQRAHVKVPAKGTKASVKRPSKHSRKPSTHGALRGQHSRRLYGPFSGGRIRGPPSRVFFSARHLLTGNTAGTWFCARFLDLAELPRVKLSV